MDALHQKLEQQGFDNITYMVVNSQELDARIFHPFLRQNMAENITLYAQDPTQDDVWTILSGDTGDFLVYDRCGLLTHHISMPYSDLSQPYMEDAIRDTYCNSTCATCLSMDPAKTELCHKPVETKEDLNEPPQPHHPHGHNHDGSHGHGHHHSHGRHGARDGGHEHHEHAPSHHHSHVDQLSQQEARDLPPQLSPQQVVLEA